VRIIAGTAGGRRIVAPAGRTTRPTSDRAREALFAILGDRVVGARVLDLFAGSGALGLEALSRGARAALFVDNDRRALAAIARNIETLGFADRAVYLRRDLCRCRKLPAGPFDLVFCDPPYGRGLGERMVALVAAEGLLAAGGILVVEERSSETVAGAGDLQLVQRRSYGDTCFWFFSRQ